MTKPVVPPPKNTSPEVLMEFYKTYLESIEQTTNRRQQSNQFFIGLLSALLALVGFVLNIDGLTAGISAFILLLTGGTGILLCLIWRRYIRSSVMLNVAKFEVLLDMEERLAEQPFKDEWGILQKNGYKGLGSLEEWLPWLLMIPYVVVIGFGVVILLNG